MGQSVHQKARQVNQKLLGKLREIGLFGKYDLVFVIHPGNRGWILDAICKEIANYFPGTCYFHYATSHLQRIVGEQQRGHNRWVCGHHCSSFQILQLRQFHLLHPPP